VQFPISVLFEAPSVAKCAAMIAERIGGDTTTDTGTSTGTGTGTAAQGDSARKGPVHRHLVALHQGDTGQKQPFFVVAGMGGNVLNLRHLALMLGRDRPVYGFQARGLIGDDEPHRSLPDAARDYITELRSIQAHGPYFLGGYSGGGITAYEMARQLESDGEVVSVLAMLDTPLPVRPTLTRRDKLAIKIEEFRRKGLGYISEWARNRLEWELERRKPVQGDTGDLAGFNNHKIEAAFTAAASNYELHPWNGPLTLFRPPLDRQWQVSQGAWVNRERAYVLDDNGWSDWATKLQTIEVPGDHFNMVLVPNISVLAAGLKEILETAETSQDPVFHPPLGHLNTAAE
jgi:thioesterase domain-containing protein